MKQAFSKIWLIVVLIILIAGGVFAWQYLKPKEMVPDKTANWQLYQNERFKYEIKYPPELEMLKDEFEKQGIAVETVPAISWMFPVGDTPNIAKSISVNVTENTEKKSLRSILGYDSAECKIEKEQEAFLKIDCEMEGTMRLVMSAFAKNEWVYVISLEIMSLEGLTKTDFSSEINTYGLMLSTFKFLEGEIVVPQRRSVEDVKVMADMSQIQTAAEIFYDRNNSYLNLASDPDVSSIQKQIQNEIGNWPGMITSGNAYCVDIVLSDGKTRYCVDSDGRRGDNLGCSRTQLKCISY